jgi:hypothetical protein
MIVYLILLLLNLSSAETTGTVGCETMINCTVTTGNKTVSTNTATADGTLNNNQMSGFTTVTTTTNYASAGDAGSGSYSQAKEGKTQSLIMGAVAVGLGARYMSRCGRSNRTACFLAAAAFSAAGLAAGKAMQSQQVMNSLGNDQRSQGTVDTSNTADTSLMSDLNKLKADLASQGYSVDDSGNITTPEGSTVNGDLSASSLTGAGMSEQDANKLQNDLAEMRKELHSKAGAGGAALVAQSSGSTGYGRVSMASLEGSQNETTTGVEAERTGIDRDPAAWNGFFKKFGDGLIGVSHSDIFLMVEKRVETERTGMGN